LKKISEEDLLHIYDHTHDLWAKLQGKSILITGATGFFGKWLLESFVYINEKLSLNATVFALSRNPEFFLQKNPFYSNKPSVKFIKGDVTNFDYPQGEFNYIIHAATDADAKLNEENPLLMMDTITLGTRRLLDFARQQPLEGFLLTSSGAVYGKQPADVAYVKETDSFTIDISDAASAYAEGKRVAELYCAAYHKQFNVPVKIARCFAFVGPYLPLDKHFAIGNFIQNGINKEGIIIKGDGRAYRSYMYAADLTIWLWKILFTSNVNIAYNVGSSCAVNIKETAEAVAAEFDNKIDITVLGKANNLLAHRYVPDVTKAQNELNLYCKIDLKEAINRTIKFHTN